MESNSKYFWITAVLILIVAGLFIWARLTNPYRPQIKSWNTAGILCLGGHQQASLHIHPRLTIIVEDREESIPAEIGLVPGCMAEIHTHDSSGTLHVESVTAGKQLRLKDFFTVWGKSLERDGYRLEAEVDDQSLADPASLTFADGQKILLNYISFGFSPSN